MIASTLAVLALAWPGAGPPRPEHPEPMMVRPHWLNLNGEWSFRFDPKDEGLAAHWERPGAPGFDAKIVVPFGWESELSGLKAVETRGVAWYRREFSVPESFPKGRRLFLNFGAVDWRADVWVNGQKVASHEGGYTPFSADVTEAVGPKTATVVVRVFDPTDPELPTGKQVGWYTPTSGIWQTVWLESRPAVHVKRLTIVPGDVLASATVRAEVEGGAGRLVVTSDDPTVESVPGSGIIKVKDARPWSPESPKLYPITVALKTEGAPDDVVQTYFGLRTIKIGKSPGSDRQRLLLNGKPLYLRAALDQSFNPAGLYTAPSDAFLKTDLELAKSVGLNALRIHIKPEEPRRLYWADVLGVLVMQDMPNAWRQSPKSRLNWEATMREALPRDLNHPAIFSWVAFNETWGLGDPPAYKKDKDTQEWVARMVREMRKIDPTRIIEDNSPCNYDHVEETDLNSWHFYIDDYEEGRRHLADVVERSTPGSPFNMCPGRKQPDVPLINSEYGGVSAGGGDRDVSWCFRHLTTQLRRHDAIQGYVYTELTDIEWEHNGFFNYDRTPKDFGYDEFVPGMTVKDLQGADFVGFDGPPAREVRWGEQIDLPVFVSHYSDRKGPFTLRRSVRLGGGDHQVVPGTEAKLGLELAPFAVSGPPPVSVVLPDMDPPFALVAALVLELFDESGERVAANYQNLWIKPAKAPSRNEARGASYSFAFDPGEFSGRTWGSPARAEGKAVGRGAGHFEYRFKLPKEVVAAGPKSVQLAFEASSRAGREKVDWPQRSNAQDNPQTDVRKWPATLVVSANGAKAEAVVLKDDPADSRGVLSHLRGVDHGSYGERTTVAIELTESARAELAKTGTLVVRFTVPDEGAKRGGLAIFGATTGRFGADPVATIATEKEIAGADGLSGVDPLTVNSLRSRLKVALATGESATPTTWAHVTDDPGAGWEGTEFDDASWKRGPGGFGTRETPAVVARSRWSTTTIWLRTTVELPKLGPNDEATLRVFHDEDVEVFVNGTRVFAAKGYVTAYQDVPLGPEGLAAIKAGANVVAVKCKQTGGGQGIDVGLSVLKAED